MQFPKACLYKDGGDVIDPDIDKMRESILKKDGIVSTEAAEDFRFFVKNCMNRSILDQIGGKLSSFEKKSFRMA